MAGNPYRLADRRQRIARRRGAGLADRLSPLLLLGGAVGAVWLARDVYATVLGGNDAAWAVGFQAIATRVGLVLAALLSLSTYDIVVRGPDRGVVDLHPLLPGPWLRARALLVARARAGWLVLAAVFLLPLLPRVDTFALGLAVAVGGWLAGIGAGLGVNLSAPRLAAEPSLAWMFDAIRGPNPRLQAALLYAPGVALALSGSATLAASWGAGRLLAGDTAGAVGLAAPLAVAIAGYGLATRAAPASAGIGAVLGEIEGAWAHAAAAEDARAVYLEWAVRFAPAGLRLGLLKDLRHLWRAHRGWVGASWGFGLLTAVAGWSAAPSAPAESVRVGAAVIGVFGLVGVRMGAADPKWLDELLPLPGRVPARALGLFGAMQVVVLLGAPALAVRHGIASAALAAARLELCALVCAAVAAWAGDALRGRGGFVYLPVAALVWSLGGTP